MKALTVFKSVNGFIVVDQEDVKTAFVSSPAYTFQKVGSEYGDGLAGFVHSWANKDKEEKQLNEPAGAASAEPVGGSGDAKN